MGARRPWRITIFPSERTARRRGPIEGAAGDQVPSAFFRLAHSLKYFGQVVPSGSLPAALAALYSAPHARCSAPACFLAFAAAADWSPCPPCCESFCSIDGIPGGGAV